MNMPATFIQQETWPHDQVFHDQEKSAEILINGLQSVIHDYQHLLQSLRVEHYCASPDGQSSIGAHVRHVLEFMQVLAAQITDGVIDYEARAHDVSMESNPLAVADTLSKLLTTFRAQIETYGLYRLLLLKETAVLGHPRVTTTSSVGREILFIIQHSVHHLAIIKMKTDALGLHMRPDLGVANATKLYRAETQS